MFAAAHLEGFGSIEGVARAKGEIYCGLTPNGVAIIKLLNIIILNCGKKKLVPMLFNIFNGGDYKAEKCKTFI